MTFDLKDIIYVAVYLISVVGVYYGQKNRIGNLEKENSEIKGIIFADRGKLNLIDHETCKKYRDDVYTAIRRNEQVNEMLLNKIDKIGENVLLLGFKLEALLKDMKKIEKRD